MGISPELRAALDQVRALSTAENRERGAAGGPLPASNPSGLRFRPGDRVLDSESGQVGVIEAGERRSPGAEEVYRVRLADMRTVHRAGGTLELAPAPPAPAPR